MSFYTEVCHFIETLQYHGSSQTSPDSIHGWRLLIMLYGGFLPNYIFHYVLPPYVGNKHGTNPIPPTHHFERASRLYPASPRRIEEYLQRPNPHRSTTIKDSWPHHLHSEPTPEGLAARTSAL
jgi:hypothetical protein